MEVKERALAHIEKIEWVKPIEGADNIELIGILGWICISKKGEFHPGDLVVYIEIDSKCPSEDERFAFLESKKYKIKTMKLGKFNVISQGLAMPISQFPEIQDKKIGTDVTKELKIKYSSLEDIKRKSNIIDPNAKYKSMAARHKELFQKKPIRWLMKREWGKKLLFLFFGRKKDNPKGFPNWIVKTDETRIENAPFYLDMKTTWIKTEKLDGTSCTFAIDTTGKKTEYIVCSRNVRQADRDQECFHEVNVYWEMSDKYNIYDVLQDIVKKKKCKRAVIQGEGIGNVQGNPYKVKENDLYVFNVIIDGVRMGSIEAKKLVESYGMKFVPIIDTNYTLPDNMEDMKIEADGFSAINPKVMREGFIYRTKDGTQSFKNVSREYLIKHSS